MAKYQYSAELYTRDSNGQPVVQCQVEGELEADSRYQLHCETYDAANTARNTLTEEIEQFVYIGKIRTSERQG